ncbi:hypothetical protein HOC67_01810, partial [Candidatus Peregrinibacteria bacterium]|nr:hypothetical protein [Candidatus Peregrinibacteria bacterium]
GSVLEESTIKLVEKKEEVVIKDKEPTVNDGGERDKAKQQGFTGSICGSCGSLRVKTNGSCELCLDCGATSGCS